MADVKIELELFSKQLQKEVQKTESELKKLGKQTDSVEDGVKKNEKAMKAFGNLGVRSSKQIKAEILKLQKSYQALENSGTATTEDLARAKKKLETRVESLNRELKGVDGNLDNLDGSSKSSSMGATLGGWAMAAGAVVGALSKVYDGLKQILGKAGEFEQTRIALETMTGSAEVAGATLAEIQEFSANTPFEFPELANSTKQLMAFGMAPRTAIDTMKALGDVAAGTGADIGELSSVIGKIKSKGKAQTEELNQLAERGIPIYDELAKVTGKSGDELRKMVESGAIGLPEIQESLSNMTSEGGKFFGMMEKQSNSLLGLVSTLKDNFGIFLNQLMGIDAEGNIAEDSIMAIAKDLVEKLISGVKEFGPIVSNVVGHLVAMFSAVQTGSGDMQILKGIALVAGNVLLAVFGSVAMSVNSVKAGIWLLKRTFVTVVDFILLGVASIIDSFAGMGNVLGKVVGVFNKEAGEKIQNVTQGIKNFSSGLKDQVEEDFSTTMTEGKKRMDELKGSYKDMGAAFVDLNKGMISGIEEPVKKTLEEVGTEAGETGGEKAGTAWIDAMEEKFDAAKPRFKQALEDLEKNANKSMEQKKASIATESEPGSGGLPVSEEMPVQDMQADGNQSFFENIVGTGENIRQEMEIAAEAVQDAHDTIAPTFNALGNLFSNLTKKIDAETDAQVAAVEKSAMSEKAKEEKIAQIRADSEKKKAELAKKRKPLIIAEAIANTALAVTNALANGIFPLNLVTAAIIAAAGAVQVATIAATPYREGGIFEPGDRGFIEGGQTEFIAPKRKFEQVMRFDLVPRVIAGLQQDFQAATSGLASAGNTGTVVQNFNYNGPTLHSDRAAINEWQRTTKKRADRVNEMRTGL